MLDMAKRRAPQRQDGRSDLGVGDDLDAEDVGESGTAVVAEGAEDEVLALLVEDEDAGQHGRDRVCVFGGRERRCGRRGGR